MKTSFLAPTASGYFCGPSGDSNLQRVSAGQGGPAENEELDLTVTIIILRDAEGFLRSNYGQVDVVLSSCV